MPRIYNRKRYVFLFLLFVLAWIELFWGNKVYGIFIIAFFIILLVFRPPSFSIIAASALVIVFFTTPTIESLTELRNSNLNTISHPKQPLVNILSPNSGQEVLPLEVQEMLALLQTHNITSYRISEQMEQNLLIDQRIREAAWPIQFDTSSSYLFVSPHDLIIIPNCVVMDQREDVVLEYCH